MSSLILQPADIVLLTRLAEVLIPGTEKMPAVGEIGDYDDLLRRAVAACGYTEADLRAAIDAIPAGVDWEGARAFSLAEPMRFGIVSVIVSAAYYMARPVLDRLNFPAERRHPAADDDFANEYMTGILDPVTERGPIYRETGATGLSPK